jgi:regulatory protein
MSEREGRRPPVADGRRRSSEDPAFAGDHKGGAGAAGGEPEARMRDPEARAREVCLRLLTLAPRTRAQLADALRRRGIADEVAEEVLGRFEDVGLIDDAAFARAWVESRHYSRGLAGRALSAELKQRGVAAEEIRAAIDEQLGPEAEISAARQLVEKKLGATRGLPPEQRTRRLAGMLARKGYPAGLAFRVIREALEGDGEQALPEEEQPFNEDDSSTDGSGGREW